MYTGLIELRKFKIARLYLSNALKNVKADEHAKKLLESLEMDLFLNSGQVYELHSLLLCTFNLSGWSICVWISIFKYVCSILFLPH